MNSLYCIFLEEKKNAAYTPPMVIKHLTFNLFRTEKPVLARHLSNMMF